MTTCTKSKLLTFSGLTLTALSSYMVKQRASAKLLLMPDCLSALLNSTSCGDSPPALSTYWPEYYYNCTDLVHYFCAHCPEASAHHCARRL